MKILSIDPGLSHLGYAIIEKTEESIKLLRSGVVVFEKKSTIQKKLYDIYYTFFEIILSNTIDEIGIETPFLGKNPATYMKLGYIRAIIYLLCEIHGINPFEFSPQEVKRLITGYGSSDKEVVFEYIKKRFPSIDKIFSFDESDAIAVGICVLKSKGIE